jgi:hypothetical protein
MGGQGQGQTKGGARIQGERIIVMIGERERERRGREDIA